MKRSGSYALATVFFVLSSPLLAQGDDCREIPGQLCPDPNSCPNVCADGRCDNSSYKPLECWPSEYGPTDANIVETTNNFLYCSHGTYALCFYSGPTVSLGDEGNPVLPCRFDAEKRSARCRCEVFTGPYYVDIYSIQNRDVYYQTVEKCGMDGSGCWSMGNGCTAENAKSDDCKNLTGNIPVCHVISAQSSGGSTDPFFPGADVISAYSTKMQEAGYPDPLAKDGTVACGPGLYAGCMTASCQIAEDGSADSGSPDFAWCDCPTYQGRPEHKGCYQIPNAGQPCNLNEEGERIHVWSSSNNVATVDQSTCENKAPAGK